MRSCPRPTPSPDDCMPHRRTLTWHSYQRPATTWRFTVAFERPYAFCAESMSTCTRKQTRPTGTVSKSLQADTNYSSCSIRTTKRRHWCGVSDIYGCSASHLKRCRNLTGDHDMYINHLRVNTCENYMEIASALDIAIAKVKVRTATSTEP